ncbi:MAG: HYR domain-containing protein [Acidobacteria bacterium]|nr:HYR domain-containing protein [Acidobacteriota bacterium]
MKPENLHAGLPISRQKIQAGRRLNQWGTRLQKVFLLPLILVFLAVGVTPTLKNISASSEAGGQGASKTRAVTQEYQESPPGKVRKYKPGQEPIPGVVEWESHHTGDANRPNGQFTTEAGTDDCPGRVICSLPFTDSDTTVGANDTITTIPMACNGSFSQVAGPDKVYVMGVDSLTSLTITCTPTGPAWDVSIYLVDTCPGGTGGVIASGCVAGADANGPGGAETISVTGLSKKPYYLVVDSFYAASGSNPNRQGSYDLSITGSGLLTLPNLRITKTDNVTTVAPGGTLTYTIVVSNEVGFCSRNAVIITDTLPAQIASATWTSVATGGALGNSLTGTGNINNTKMTFPPGSSVTYTVTAIVGAAATGTISNTATIGAQVTNYINFSPNSATDTTTIMAIPSCMLTCPSNIVTSNTAGECGAVVTFAAPLTTGSCGTVTAIPASGSFFGVGSTTVNVTSTAGPTCSFTVTVNDTELPVVTCPGDIVTGATSTAGAVVTFNPSASDNCSIASIEAIPPSGSVFPIGTTPVTVTATDASNNTATCTFMVTVQGVELDRVYVADTANDRTQVFDGATWQLVPGTLGAVGSSIGQFRRPEAITANADGSRIYVADTGNNRIQFTTDSGATWHTFATMGSGSSQVRTPQGLALDLAGNLYVADTGNNRLMRFDGGVPGAAVIFATAGSTLGKVSTPRGLAVDANRTLYVADFGNNRIQSFTTADVAPTPGLVATTGSSVNPGQVRSPEGVAVDNEGNLYVADTGNNRVIAFIGGVPGPAVLVLNVGSTFGKVRLPEGITVCQGVVLGGLATESALIVGDTANNRIQGSLTPTDPLSYELVGNPLGGSGPLIGNFRSPSKIR